MNRKCLLLFLLLIIAVLGHAEEAAAQAPIYFDDTDPETLVLGNDTYEIGISKTNGALTYILDKATGEHVSTGSRYGCLWGAVFEPAAQPNDYAGGCLYEHGFPDRAFTWTWRPVDHRLSLRYLANPERYVEVNVWVDITLSTKSWFEMRLFLVFHSDRDNDIELYKVNLDGTNVQRLTQHQGMDNFPTWSPDGQHIIFTSDRSGAGRIWVMATDRTGLRMLVSGSDYQDYAAWSPSGSSIAFMSSRDGNGEIYTVKLDGTKLKRLTQHPAQDIHPAWGP